jgi:large subunit ribosomal protein L21
MYAVIKTGGKQYRVEEGQRLDVERVGGDEGTELSLTPLLVVDGDTVLSAPADLAKAAVKAKVVGAATGPKIVAATYKNKSRSLRRWGHRQHYATIEITGITGVTTTKSKSKDGD